jgi:hypothetical protein
MHLLSGRRKCILCGRRRLHRHETLRASRWRSHRHFHTVKNRVRRRRCGSVATVAGFRGPHAGGVNARCCRVLYVWRRRHCWGRRQQWRRGGLSRQFALPKTTANDVLFGFRSGKLHLVCKCVLPRLGGPRVPPFKSDRRCFVGGWRSAWAASRVRPLLRVDRERAFSPPNDCRQHKTGRMQMRTTAS